MITGKAKIRFKFNGKIYNIKDSVTIDDKDKKRLRNYVSFVEKKEVIPVKEKFTEKIITKTSKK